MKSGAKRCGRMVEYVAGKPVPCGRCNFCIGRRANYWTARGLMEKACALDTLVLTLTYRDDDGVTALGARQFYYAHIRLFLQNLRDAVDAKLGREGGLRFLVCGETGDRFKRVHWHVVLFSQVDLTTCGTWSAPWGPVTDRKHIVSAGQERKPCQWSIWPHGTVLAQEPDRGGLRYALSYVVKDAFALDNADGTARQGSSEFDAAGYFRQSKGLPIGMPFVERWLEECAAGGFIRPDARLNVPGLDMPVGLQGKLRERVMAGYRAINDARRLEHGSNCAAWSALVYNMRDREPDLRLLGVWPTDDDPDFGGPEDAVGVSRVQISGAYQRREEEFHRKVRRRCGSAFPCRDCLHGMSDQELAALALVRVDGGGLLLRSDYLRLADDDGNAPPAGTAAALEWSEARRRVHRLQWDGARGAGVNPHCQMRGSRLFERVFPLSDASARAAVKAARASDAPSDVPLLGSGRHVRRHKSFLR